MIRPLQRFLDRLIFREYCDPGKYALVRSRLFHDENESEAYAIVGIDESTGGMTMGSIRDPYGRRVVRAMLRCGVPVTTWEAIRVRTHRPGSVPAARQWRQLRERGDPVEIRRYFRRLDRARIAERDEPLEEFAERCRARREIARRDEDFGEALRFEWEGVVALELALERSPADSRREHLEELRAAERPLARIEADLDALPLGLARTPWTPPPT